MEKIASANLYQVNQAKQQTQKQAAEDSKKSEVNAKPKEDYKLDISDKAKELKKDLTGAEAALKIHRRKFGQTKEPGIYFISGFDWFGASSVKGNYDGIRDMAEAVEGADHYAWDEQEKIIQDIKKRAPDQPIVLVGHSFGGDTAYEIADTLNTIENGFRKIDLLVTLDSVGFDNDKIPQNVTKNLNFIAQGPYDILNDGPNIAKNYLRTDVQNFLRNEEHADLDDSTDIQITILEEIQRLV